MTLKKLKKYNFGTLEYPSQISTLDEFLKVVKNNKIILIEIKDKSEECIEKIYQVIKKYNLNYYLCSFHYNVIKKFKSNYNYKCGLIIGFGQNIKKLYNHFDFNIISYYYKDKVSKKKETFIWTLNNRKNDIENLNVITDYPTLVKSNFLAK